MGTQEGELWRKDRKGVEWFKVSDNPETWESKNEIVVLGSPAEGSDHNCDAMGCGQCHVIERYRKEGE